MHPEPTSGDEAGAPSTPHRGDRALALAAAYAAHGAACLAHAVAVTGDAGAAHEAVQQAFLACWRSDGALGAADGRLRASLLEETHRAAVARRRTDRGRGAPAPGPAPVLDLASEPVRRALDALPALEREALVLAFWGGHTQQEIAALTETPLGAVRRSTLHGLRRLHAALAAPGTPAQRDADGRTWA